MTSSFYPLTSIFLHAALEPKGVSTVDTAGTPRVNFNSTEAIGFYQRVANTAKSINQIQFTFTVTDPAGRTVFSQSGNAASGSIANDADCQITGIQVSQIYTIPGNYTLTATAALDSQTVTQSAVFAVSSPVLSLLYPPDGSRGISASPLTFHWSGSGASQYRITVDDEPSFYNALFTGYTVGPEMSFFYPSNPSDPRQRLASGQLYFWKVEALDLVQTRLAESNPPFSFVLNEPSAKASSRDLAVIRLELLPETSGQQKGAFVFEVTVANQGGQAESKIPVTLYLNGVATRDSPKTIASLGPGDSQKLVLAGAVSKAAKMILAQAQIVFFDDNLNNNRLLATLRLGELLFEEKKETKKKKGSKTE